jgi:L-2-hydroxyglutarate oxidase LhgO
VQDVADCVVVGAGVVGLAIARALAIAGREVLIVEAAGSIGTGTSARNSEVVHAGMYYTPGSLRALLCVRGQALLYEYCAARGVPHRRCGKLIVAANADEEARLEGLRAQALANGVDDLEPLTPARASALEPALACSAALLSPSTGIVDAHALMLALLGDAEALRATLALRSTVTGGEATSRGIVLRVGGEAGSTFLARTVVNAAGHGAPALAGRLQGLAARHVPRAYLAKGCYFTLTGRPPFSHLVYPVPGTSGHLGVHFTLDMGGQGRFGPSFRWVEAEDYGVDESEAPGFYAAVRRYWPALPDGALRPGYAGIRPRVSGPDEPLADFRIEGPATHGVPGLVNLFGIDSPGLTAALAIAERVQALIDG